MICLRCVHNLDLREIRELDDLCQKLERSRNNGLGGNNRRKDGQDHTENEAAGRSGVEDRIRVCLRTHSQVRCLANIGQQQAGKTPAQPADLDRTHAKGAQVGEESLHSGEGEQHASQRSPAVFAMADQIIKGLAGVECFEHSGVEHDQVVDSEGCKQSEPNDDNGSELGNLSA